MCEYWVQGYTINTFDPLGKQYPLIYAGDAPNLIGGFTGSISRYIKRDKKFITFYSPIYSYGVSFRVFVLLTFFILGSKQILL